MQSLPCVRRILRLVAAVGTTLSFLACTIETEQPAIAGRTVRLSILHTSDIHSRLYPYDMKPLSTDENYGLYQQTYPYGGVERIAALIARERQRSDRVLYLDSGDIFQGAPIFNYADGEPEFRWLSTVGADAVLLGNHEFDRGVDNLVLQAARWIHYPWLAANYIFDDFTDETKSQLGRQVQPYAIVNVKGLRVAVIGMGDVSSTYSITEGGNSMGVTPIESNETVRAYLEFLSPQVDLILVLSHLSLTGDEELIQGHEFYMTRDKEVACFLNRKQDPWRQMDCPECQPQVVKYFIPGVRGIDAILGGHLHIVLHPPQVLTDPAGRKVVLEHPGAFAKYLTRLDLAVAVPHPSYRCDTDQRLCLPRDSHFSRGVACITDADCARSKLAPYGAEVVANEHQIFPIDSFWCANPRPPLPLPWDQVDQQRFDDILRALNDYCGARGHAPTRNLLEPFRINLELDPRFDLTRVFGYAPQTILRRNSTTGGDAALGNLTALSMMIRRRVEAEFGVTNTLGIRDHLYPGLVNMETIFNIFPFENTITIMYLSGREVQELFDFVTERSTERGCQSQAQIAGCSFVMNCGQDRLNQMLRGEQYRCQSAEDCCPYRPEICEPDYPGTARWECRQGACYSHPAEDILMGGKPLNPDASYKLATNDYIAKGGSGFWVLKRNTTKVYTGIAMRDALVEYLMRFPNCNQLLAQNPEQIDAFALSFCVQASQDPENILVMGACTCKDTKANDTQKCGAITVPMLQFCNHPLDFPILVGKEDGRIKRVLN